MHILIAPNAFKNSLDADAVAKAIDTGLRQSQLKCTRECFPVGDGGDGTGRLLIRKCRGRIVSARVHDPLGRKINAGFGLIEGGKTAVIEMADASGLRLLRRDEFDPVRASSAGTGEIILRALERGVRQIIIGVGGSATVDGGVGILQALGVRFRDRTGKEITALPEDLIRLHSIDMSGLDPRAARCDWTILCDVRNPLLGERGAARVFGPQKGATPSLMLPLESRLVALRDAIERLTGKDVGGLKHGGAAGGAAAGLHGLLKAKLVNGIDCFLELTGFDRALTRAGLVITGEGSMDEQTLQGKGPLGVAARARKRKIPVVALAGRISARAKAQLRKYFDELLTIGRERMDLETALARTAADLQHAARELGNRLAQKR